jgi:hypothetical protein
VGPPADAELEALAATRLRIHRLARTSGSWDRLYTISAAERDQVVASLGYASGGVVAYVSAPHAPDRWRCTG